MQFKIPETEIKQNIRNIRFISWLHIRIEQTTSVHFNLQPDFFFCPGKCSILNLLHMPSTSTSVRYWHISHLNISCFLKELSAALRHSRMKYERHNPNSRRQFQMDEKWGRFVDRVGVLLKYACYILFSSTYPSTFNGIGRFPMR